MDTVREGKGGRGRSDTGRPAYFESYLETFIRQAPAGERDTDQLSLTLAGALLDTDDTYLLGSRAGSNGESGSGAVTFPVSSGN